jgi:site-specific DNA recombinase
MKPFALTVAIYARAASTGRHQPAWLNRQLAELRARVARDGCELRDEHIMVDDGYSGSYLDRPGLARLRDLVREQLVQRLYVGSPDRLTRSFAHLAVLVEEFERAGCELICLDEAPSSNADGLPGPESMVLSPNTSGPRTASRCDATSFTEYRKVRR